MENDALSEVYDGDNNEIDINTSDVVENEQNMVKRSGKGRSGSGTKYAAVQGYTKSDGTRVRPHLRRVKK